MLLGPKCFGTEILWDPNALGPMLCDPNALGLSETSLLWGQRPTKGIQCSSLSVLYQTAVLLRS